MAAVGAGCASVAFGDDRRPVTSGVAAAVAWLVERQADDGAWRSANYAPLKRGDALTPHVLLAAGENLPDDARRRAAEFVRQSASHDGGVGFVDPELPEYPNYATSLALECLVEAGHAADRSRIDKLCHYLVAQQYSEANGFASDHPAYGGWGFGGPRPVGDSPGHMDLGHTRHVVQALRAAGHDDPQTYARAERFLHRLQKRDTPAYDGGLCFSPIVHAANKGGETTLDGVRYFNSYATATCDGVLALSACGVKRDDPRIVAARGWLERHPRLDFPEGVLEGTDTNWGASLRFYHFAVRAECYAALDWPGAWRHELRNFVTARQQADGSFVNREGFLMKEDDPILCTALAVAALASCARRK